MRRRLSASAAAVVLVLVSVVTPVRVWAQVDCAQPVQGVITAIDARSGTFTMRLSNGAGTAVAWVQRSSGLQLSDLRVGDRVSIRVACLDDGRLLVLSGTVARGPEAPANVGGAATGGVSGAPPGAPAVGGSPAPGTRGKPGSAGSRSTSQASPVLIAGTVMARTAASLVINGKSGSRLTVIIDGGTRVSGQRRAAVDIAVGDQIKVFAIRQPSGQLRAASVDVSAASTKTITGTVTSKGPGYIVIDGTQTVRTSEQTVVLSNGKQTSVNNLPVGAQVTVFATVEKSPAGSVARTAEAVVIKVKGSVLP